LSIRSFFHNLITSNLPLEETDIQLKKVRLINFILLLATPINTFFIYVNYASEQYRFAAFNVVMVIVMLISFFMLRRSEKNILFAANGTLLGMYISHLAALLQGGIANSGFVWFFLFPLFALFLTGPKIGKRWLAVLFASIIITFMLQDHLPLPYEPIYLVFILIALILESFYVRFSQRIQLRYEAELSEKNQALKALTGELQQSNEELQHLTDHLQAEVKEQVALVRSKDNILTQQAKMASVGEMMSFISHQWKQPITTIDVTVQNVQLAKELEAENLQQLSDEAFADILTQTSLMLTTMREFLQFSRPSEDKAFTISHAFEMLQQLIGANFRNHNVELTMNQPSHALTLHGKENEFVHAIMNIANNAKDVFSEKNIVGGKVAFDVKEDNEIIILTVSDNAGGIPKDIINNIFEAYFSTKLDKGGTGLGLHMSHKIITENMHGDISVKNSSEGACFTLTIPKYKA
jgi:signal transduction histidine kinase